MNQLIMTDGTIKNVSYEQAATIYQVLIGNQEPKNEEQADFVMHVADVKFEKQAESVRHHNRRLPIQGDQAMKEILADSKLTGWDKARLVAKRIRER